MSVLAIRIIGRKAYGFHVKGVQLLISEEDHRHADDHHQGQH
jgi:hypothetical protein